MKYSIIIPVYNVEKYLRKCLDSILKQTFKNYEVILIDDGSKDTSIQIINEYIDKIPEKFKGFFFEKNKGQSAVRNFGITKATGDYLFFIDSDDYIDEQLLEEINNKLLENPELEILKIAKRGIDERTGKILNQNNFRLNTNVTGKEAFLRFRKNKIGIDTPWTYIIRKDYWVKNNFKFSEGRIMEDFGLMPLVLIMASSVNAIDYPFYNHVKRENSTITKIDYESTVKKAFDVLHHYDFLFNSIQNLYKKDDNIKREFIQYISDKVFGYLKQLEGEELSKYMERIKEKHLISNLKVYSLKSLLKIILYKYYMFYYK